MHVSLIRKLLPQKRERKFQAGQYHNAVADWIRQVIGSFTQEIRDDLKSVRTRSRDASINDPYARAYFQTVANEIIGSKGIGVKFVAEDAPERLDERANKLLQDAFDDWAKSCTVDGLTLVEAQKLWWKTLKRDGEVLWRMRQGRQYGPYGCKIQFIDIERLDETYEATNSQTGNRITAGVEIDGDGAPVTLWVWLVRPDHLTPGQNVNNRRIPIPVSELFLDYEKERPDQYRGFPALSAALLPLAQIATYRKHELFAAGMASAKMGFYERDETADGDLYGEGDIDADGNPVESGQKKFRQKVEGGVFEVMPQGYRLSTFDVNHPNGNFPTFVNANVKPAFSSVGTAAHTVTNDLSDINYSSIRQGAIEEREQWLHEQEFIVSRFLGRIVPIWVRSALFFRAVPLPFAKLEKFLRVEHQKRRWPFIDPSKEAAMVKGDLEHQLTSQMRLCRDRGYEYEDVVAEIAQAKKIREKYGVSEQEVASAIIPSDNGNQDETETDSESA